MFIKTVFKKTFGLSVATQYVYTTDELVTELQPGQPNVKIMTRPTVLTAMQKNANPSNTDIKRFSVHFEDLEASWVDVSAIINSTEFDYVLLTNPKIVFF